MKKRFAYWNINKQPESFLDVMDATLSSDFEVLVLVENTRIASGMIEKRFGLKSVDLKQQNNIKNWVQVFYKEAADISISHHSEYTEIEEEAEDELQPALNDSINRNVNRIQVFKIFGSIEDTYFACVHFPSKLYHDEISHLQIVPNYREKVHSLTLNSNRVFIMGDFNMNPFDYGMVEPTAFYAHNNRSLVDVDSHFKFGGKRILYYNPCWTLLGDFINDTAGASRVGGTYYFDKSCSRKLYWHLIDQIILRKSLINEFETKDLTIVETPELIKELLKERIKGMPKIDHLPLKFSFNFTQQP